MTDNERRVLKEWRKSCEAIGGQFRAADMVDMLTDLLDADTDVTPKRPEIGEQFWLRGTSEPEWTVWTATTTGIAVVDSDGEPWRKKWSDFDRYVANGTWQWQPLEQPDD